VRLSYRLAEKKDDPAIRSLIASTPMPGAITVTFEREPDFFAGMRMAGDEWQVLLAENEDTGELAGMFCRVVQKRFVNGVPARVAYWGELRIAQSFQGSVFLPRGFALYREVCAKDPVAGNFAVIANGNPGAVGVFTQRHWRLLPALKPIARFNTFGIVLARERKAARRSGGSRLSIMRTGEFGLEGIVGFLREQGAGKQLFPVYDERYFRECGLDTDDFIVVADADRIVGVAGLWDQSGCRQTIVHSYNGLLRLARPLYNLVAPLRGHPLLPGRGERINSACLSFIAIEEDSIGVFAALLREACARAFDRGFDYLMLGLAEADPLAAAPRALPHVPYTSTLYMVEIDPSLSFAGTLDGRVPYVEISTL
jgi:hypothetical protein